MKTGFKLLTSGVSICAVLGLMGYGVYAAVESSLSAGTNGEIAFEAKTVYVSVAGEITDEAANDYNLYDYNEKSYTTLGGTSTSSLQAWDLGKVVFSEENSYVIYSVSITNDSTFAIVTTYTHGENLHSSLALSTQIGTEELGNKESFSIAPHETKQITIKYSLISFAESIESQPVSFSFAMSK